MFETVAEFLERFDAKHVGQLVGTSTGGAVNEARITRALEDATAELEGYLPRVPAAHKPSAATLKVHCHKVAVYLLTLDRPGKEFDQIRTAYADTIGFYTALIQGAQAQGGSPPVEVTFDAPEPVFTDATLKGLV